MLLIRVATVCLEVWTLRGLPLFLFHTRFWHDGSCYEGRLRSSSKGGMRFMISQFRCFFFLVFKLLIDYFYTSKKFFFTYYLLYLENIYFFLKTL